MHAYLYYYYFFNMCKFCGALFLVVFFIYFFLGLLLLWNDKITYAFRFMNAYLCFVPGPKLEAFNIKDSFLLFAQNVSPIFIHTRMIIMQHITGLHLFWTTCRLTRTDKNSCQYWQWNVSTGITTELISCLRNCNTFFCANVEENLRNRAFALT